jgi:hypothetical protein
MFLCSCYTAPLRAGQIAAASLVGVRMGIDILLLNM